MLHNDIYYTILSLLTDERKQIVESNLNTFPFFTITKSINGYDIDETIEALKKSKLVYRRLEFPTYGTLANFLTKYNILQYQISEKIPYLCFLEDDLLLSSNFVSFIEKTITVFNINNSLNMIRLDRWGEGYVTSLAGANRIITKINKDGIIQNIDNQLRKFCGPEYVARKTPWKLLVKTNGGDCLKTKKIIENLDKL